MRDDVIRDDVTRDDVTRDGVLRVAFLPSQRRVKRSSAVRLTQIGLLWVGFALALPLLDRFALREDEAIYSYWALHFWRIDPYFLTVWPDKPPLFLWLLAGVLHLWGASQASGRLLNILVTLLTALVVGATARRLWGKWSGLVATALYLLNPFALSFAPTVYTDPLLVLTGQLAFFCAITGRGLGAGLWLAAALMTKQQGAFYVPLIALALWLQPGARGKTTASVALWLRFLLGILLVSAPIIYWDSTRWAVAPSPWDLSVRNYGGLELAALEEWWPRTHEWAKLLWYLTASWPVWLLLAALLLATLWRKQLPGQGVSVRREPPSPSAGKVEADDGIDTTDLLGRWFSQPADALIGGLALWCGGFLVLHIITTVQLWDRYLLPLAPPLCLWAAWTFMEACRCSWQSIYSKLAGFQRSPLRFVRHSERISGALRPGDPFRVAEQPLKGQAVRLQTAPTKFAIGRKPRLPWRLMVSGVGLLCLLPPALTVAHGGLPIGGDHGAYSGLTAAIARLQQEAPADAILYHQRLGWHYQFYLFDKVTIGAYNLRWYPTTTYLAANAAQSPDRPRFLVLPDWAPQPDLPFHLATRRLSLQQIAQVGRMTLYRIENEPQGGCVWCRCQMRRPWPIWPNLDRQGESCPP